MVSAWWHDVKIADVLALHVPPKQRGVVYDHQGMANNKKKTSFSNKQLKPPTKRRVAYNDVKVSPRLCYVGPM